MFEIAAGIAVGLLLADRRRRGIYNRVAAGESFRRIQRAPGQQTGCAATHVRLNVGTRDRIGRLGPGFQSPLLDGSVNLAEVVDACVLL